jgi:hypothetical protein
MRRKSLVYRSHLRRRACRREASIGCRPTTARKLLRWTAALKEKREKFRRYVKNRIIPATDPTVIAINGCRLADWSIDDNGISRMPLGVEATFPVGPIAVPVSQGGRIDGEARRIPRYSIKNANGAEVRTDSFLNPLYANVSALIGTVKWDMLDPLPLTVVHNPLAAVRHATKSPSQVLQNSLSRRYA